MSIIHQDTNFNIATEIKNKKWQTPNLEVSSLQEETKNGGGGPNDGVVPGNTKGPGGDAVTPGFGTPS